MRYTRDTSLVRRATKVQPFKARIGRQWMLSYCLLLLLSGLWGQPLADNMPTSREPDVKVYKIRMEYAFTLRYTNDQGTLQETSRKVECAFAFDTPISWEDALSLVDSWFEAQPLGMHSWSGFDVGEDCREPFDSIWDCWTGLDRSRCSWRPSGAELYDAQWKYGGWGTLHATDL